MWDEELVEWSRSRVSKRGLQLVLEVGDECMSLASAEYLSNELRSSPWDMLDYNEKEMELVFVIMTTIEGQRTVPSLA